MIYNSNTNMVLLQLYIKNSTKYQDSISIPSEFNGVSETRRIKMCDGCGGKIWRWDV